MPPKTHSDITAAIRASQRALRSMERSQMLEMARRWRELEIALSSTINDLLADIFGRREAGEVITPQRLQRLSRYTQLLAQVQDESTRFAQYASTAVTGTQRAAASEALRAAGIVLNIGASQGQLSFEFNRLDPAVVNAMIGNTAKGTPLITHLSRTIPADAIAGITEALIDSVARGLSIQQTAEQMMRSNAMGLQRALTVARTEQMRVYRGVTLEQYKEAGLEGWQRLSARDSNVCPACLFADDGKVYPLTYEFPSHPNCRCTVLPVVKGIGPIEHQTGQEWFELQDAATQRLILGDARYALLKEEGLALSLFSHVSHSPIWGNQLFTPRLSTLRRK